MPWAPPRRSAWPPVAPGQPALPDRRQSVAGGGGAEGYDGPAVELAYWNGLTGGDGPIMQKLVDRFNAEHPNIKVKQTRIIWDEYYQKVPGCREQRQGSRRRHHARRHAGDQRGSTGRSSRSTMWPPRSKLTEEDFAPIAWNGGLYKEKRYGIPLDIHPAGLYYNKTVLEKVGADPEKPPTNEDELMAILDKCKSKGVQGMWTSAVNANDLPGQTLLYQFGGKMVNDDGASVGWDGEAGVKAISWLKALIDERPQPRERGERRPERRVPGRQGRLHDQRTVDDDAAEREQEAQVGGGPGAADR